MSLNYKEKNSLLKLCLYIENDYGGWFVPFLFSPRDPANRKVEN
jgi:hypothetical protein